MQTTPQEEPQKLPEMPPMPPPPHESESKMSKMDKIGHAPDAIRERMPEFIKHPKESLASSINGAKETINKSLVGSKSIPTELKRVEKSYIGFFAKPISSSAKAIGQLVRFHPFKAVKEFVHGAKSNLKSIADITTSPARFAVAGGAMAVNTAKKNSKITFQGNYRHR